MTKEKKTETKVIRVKLETYKALEEMAQGFETPDHIIRRLIEAAKGKAKK